MKKTIFTLMLFVSACSNISQVGILGNVNNSERNKACMDMTQFKVLQVVEDGHALAFECNDGDYCYNNTVVLLTPQKGNYISACDGKEVVSSIKTQCTKMDGVRNDRPIYAEIITDVYAIRDVYKTTVYRRFCFPKGARSVQFVLREFIQDANNGDKQRVEVGADLDLEETNCASIEALFWDVDGKARDGVLYYRMTENGVEDYE